MAVGDLNGDGKPDVVVDNAGSYSESVLLNTTAPGTTTASFAAQQTFATGRYPTHVALADVNGDGKPDLVVNNYSDGTVSVLLNATAPGATTFSFAAQQTVFAIGSDGGVAVGDINGDGSPDLVVSSQSTHALAVLMNTPGAIPPPTLTRGTALGTITESDPAPTVQFSATDEVSAESAGAFNITVMLSAVSGTDTTIPFSLGGTAVSGSDFSGVLSSPLTIPAGHLHGIISGTLLDDGGPDVIKSLIFTLGTPTSATLGSTTQNTLTLGEFSLTTSLVRISQAAIPGGGSALVTLVVRDAGRSQISTGGLTVAFGLSNASPGGSFSSVTDNQDGTYTATLTAGTAAVGINAVTATINSQAVASTVGYTIPNSPAGIISTLTPTFLWAAVAGATAQYEIYLSDLTTGGLIDQAVNATTWTPAPLVSGHAYRWWVRAPNVGGRVGSWTNPTDFTVTAPVLLAPVLAVNNVSPQFTWNGITGVSQYEIYVTDLTAGGGVDQTVSGTAFTPTTPLVSGHSYQWWVRAPNGIWSDAAYFTVALPTLLAPSAGVSNLQPNFTWTRVTGINQYEIYLTDLTTSGFVDQTVSATNWTPQTALVSGHSYRWWVRAANGLWSNPTDFTEGAHRRCPRRPGLSARSCLPSPGMA